MIYSKSIYGFIISWVFLMGVVHESNAFQLNADSLVSEVDTIRKNKEATITKNHTKEFEQSVDTRGKLYGESYIRTRHEFWNNQEDHNFDLDDLYSFFRVKFYFGGGYHPKEKVKIQARQVNESRFYRHKGDRMAFSNDLYLRA